MFVKEMNQGYTRICRCKGKHTMLPQPLCWGNKLKCWTHPLSGVAVRHIYNGGPPYIYIYLDVADAGRSDR